MLMELDELENSGIYVYCLGVHSLSIVLLPAESMKLLLQSFPKLTLRSCVYVVTVMNNVF